MKVGFVNGKIYRSFKPLKVSSTMVISNGMVVGYDAKDADILVDLDGKVVLPGFIDSHVHLDELGLYLNSLDLRGVRSVDELKEKLKAFAERCEFEWIVGYGWDQELMGRWPTRNDIDDVVDDKPVLLSRYCLHAGVINSKVMEMCKIEEPIDSERGIVKEMAYSKVRRLMWNSFNEKDVIKFLESAIEHVLRNGVTSVCFMGCKLRIFEILKKMERDLKIRIFVYSRDFMENYRGEFLNVKGVKVFADGSLGAKTAWLSEPYEDGGSGVPLISEEELRDIVRKAKNMNLQVAVHCIGDKAIDLAIDNLNNFDKIEHASLLRDDQIDRIKERKMIVSIQPRFIVSDKLIAKRLGRRARFLYRIKSLLDKGIIVAFGTDSPIEPINPWETVYSAVTNYNIKERISVEDALHCYTRNSAIGIFEDRLGCLEEGCYADFIVVDRDPFYVDERDLKNLRVLSVYVEGEKVV